MTIGSANLANPYVGPRRFEQQESRFFFGRDEEIKILSGLVISHQLSLFYAQSGAGKSSLLHAGLLPRLTSKTRVGRGADSYLYQTMEVLPIVTVGRGVPPSTRAPINNIFSFSAQLALLPAADPNDLADRSLADSLAVLLDDGIAPGAIWESAQERDGRTRPPLLKPDATLLIIDQFEEIFTVHPERGREREAFFLQVNEALKRFPTLHILFTMREDYLAELTPYANLLVDDLRNQYRMERLRKEGALLAVTQPALAGNPSRSFAPGVAEKLVDDLRRIQRSQRSQRLAPVVQVAADGAAQVDLEHGEYVEPVHLQIVCHDLWAALPSDRQEIQESDLVNLGDVDQALINFYENTLNAVVDQTDISQRSLRRWFNEELITPARTKALIYRDEGGETAGLPNAAVDILSAAWLIRSDLRGGDTWYELAHDRLIEPILGANLAWQASYENPVAAAFARWEENKDTKLLLRDQDLVAGEAYVRQYPNEVTEDEKQYLVDSRRQWDSEQAEARRRRFLRILGSVVAVIVAGLLILIGQQMLAAQDARSEAERQERIARSRGLAIQSGQLLAKAEQGDALASAIEAGCVAETLDAFSAIRNAIDPQAWVISQSFVHEDVIEEIAWDGDQRVASVAAGRILIWDLGRGEAIDEWIIPDGIDVAKRAAWSSDGTRLATGHKSGELIIWSDDTPTTIVTAHAGSVRSVEWHPEKDVIATGGNDKQVRVWEPGVVEPIVTVDIGAVVNRVAWNAAGTRLAVAASDGSISLWDVDESWNVARRFELAAYSFLGATDIEWAKDGQLLLTAGTIGTSEFRPAAHLWPTDHPQVPLMTFGGHTDVFLYQATLSPSGALVATGGEDKEIRIWNAEDGRLLSTLRGHSGPVYSLIWLDETHLLSASSDGVMRLWNLAQATELPIQQYGKRVRALQWWDDKTILSTSDDGLGHLWRADDGAVLMEFTHAGPIYQARANAQWTQLLTPSEDGTVGVWDMVEHKEITRLGDGKGRYFFARWEQSLLMAGYECATPVCGSDRFEVHLWRAEKVLPGTSPAPDLILKGHTGSIQTVRWNPTDVIGKVGSRVVTASFDGTIRVWDVDLDSPTVGQSMQTLVHATPEISSTLSAIDRWVFEAKWNRDGSALLSYSRDGSARIWRWDSQKGGFLGTPPMRHEEPVTWADWMQDDQQVITTSADGAVRVWNTESGEIIQTLYDHTAAINGALWVDGTQSRLLTVSDDATAILWDIPGDKQIRRFVGHSDAIYGARVDEERQLLLTYGKDKTARLWNLETAEPLAILSGHKDAVLMVDWNSERTRIVTGGEDGTVRQSYREMGDLLRAAIKLPVLTTTSSLSTTLASECAPLW
jgi:WD40 repeat protein